MQNDKLTRAIETLYRVFARYEMPNELQAPEYRDPEKLRKELTSRPLRELGADTLGVYASWAMTTVDGSETFRHFLPRILELALDHPAYMGLEPWQIVSKLDYGKWRTWPRKEQEAIEAFLYAGWEFTLDDDFNSPDWLESFVVAGLDTKQALAIWSNHSSPNAMLKAAWLLSRAMVHGENGHTLQGAYWDETSLEARRHIVNWLLCPATREHLESALEKVAAGSHEHGELASGIKSLDRLATLT